LVFTYGGRPTAGKFFTAARLLGKNKLVMFWAGSDVLYAQERVAKGKRGSRWICNRIHWASSPSIAAEGKAPWPACEYVPFNWAPVVENPRPLPERFSVLTYLPDTNRTSLYGADHIVEVARSLPDMRFVMVGLREGRLAGIPPNLELHRWASDLTPFYQHSVLLCRPLRHDAMPVMVLDSLPHRRHVIYS